MFLLTRYLIVFRISMFILETILLYHYVCKMFISAKQIQMAFKSASEQGEGCGGEIVETRSFCKESRCFSLLCSVECTLNSSGMATTWERCFRFSRRAQALRDRRAGFLRRATAKLLQTPPNFLFDDVTSTLRLPVRPSAVIARLRGPVTRSRTTSTGVWPLE